MRRFAAQSPARHVQSIGAPVSHAYGSRDRNVDFANGQLIKAAFEKAGKPFEWMFVADEGHGYRQDVHVLEFYGRLEAFVRRHAG
jgi:dipeptidyl aminopeptidase/acylaminoacyl peptidase